MLTNSSRRSENEVQIYACNAQIAYIDNTKSRAALESGAHIRHDGIWAQELGVLGCYSTPNFYQLSIGALQIAPPTFCGFNID